jgi:hypothetical protein
MRAPILAVLLVLAGCVSVTPEQAVNLNEVHEAVVRLMPYAESCARERITKLTAIAADARRSRSERDGAAAQITSLSGVLLEIKLLPSVTRPIRDWGVKEAGQADYDKAKAARDERASGR